MVDYLMNKHTKGRVPRKHNAVTKTMPAAYSPAEPWLWATMGMELMLGTALSMVRVRMISLFKPGMRFIILLKRMGKAIIFTAIAA